MMCGGQSDVKDADQEVQTLLDGVRDQLETQAGQKFEQYTAVQYKTQMVAGTNYFVKVQVSGSSYIHVRIFKPLPHVNGLPELTSHQTGKTREDEIAYF